MVAVAQQYLSPFVNYRRKTLMLVAETGIRILAPHHVAKLVRPIQKPRLEHLLVQSGTVVAAGHRHLYVMLERLVRGGRPYPIRIEPLIKNEPLKNRLAVNKDLAAVDSYVAQPEITLQLINPSLATAQR